MSSSSSSPEPSPLATLQSLNTSLESVSALLAPLLEQPWQQSMDELDVLQKAKMNLLVAYGICDLVWILLRTKGIDPSNHPVMTELARIQTYYSKISLAEAPPKRQTKIDVPAAARFIASGIPKAQRVTASMVGVEVPEENTESVVGMAGRFGYLRKVDAEGLGEDEGGLRIVEGSPAGGKGKGRAVEEEEGEVIVVESGKKRKVMDAFTGYDPSTPQSQSHPSSTAASSAASPAPGQGEKKKKKKTKTTTTT